MANYRTLIIVAIIAAVVVFLYFDPMHRFDGMGKGDSTTVIIRDSTILPPVTVNIPPGQPVVVNQPLPTVIDTSEVIRAFFASLEYNDSLITDTVSIYIRETVTRGMLSSRSVKWKLNIPIQTVTEYHQSKREFMVGAMAGYSDKVTLNLMAAYKTKNGQLFIGGYDPVNRSYSLGYMRRGW